MFYFWMIILNVLRIYSFILLIRVILSWVPSVDYNNPFVKFLYQITEPILQPIRRNVPPYNGIDFSTMIVFVAIMILQRVIISIMY